jgi:hypothetical protein
MPSHSLIGSQERFSLVRHSSFTDGAGSASVSDHPTADALLYWDIGVAAGCSRRSRRS